MFSFGANSTVTFQKSFKQCNRTWVHLKTADGTDGYTDSTSIADEASIVSCKATFSANIPSFSQCATTWKNEKMYGENSICDAGSVLTCMSSALNAMNITLGTKKVVADPGTLNQYFKQYVGKTNQHNFCFVL